MYPLSLYLSKHSWGRREDLEVLSYTHTHWRDFRCAPLGHTAKPGPFPSADRRSTSCLQCHQKGSTWWQNTTALNREKALLTPGFQMAAGMLHVAADIQSWFVHSRSNQAQVTLFSSSLCGFLTVCSICWSWKVKSSSVFCLRDQTADTQKENNFKPCSWVKFLHLQTISAAVVWVFGVLSWPLGKRSTKACALWKYLHIVLCPHQ